MLVPRLLTISVCLLGAAPLARAQEPLTLVDATARALAKNHAIKIEREAEARMTRARGDHDRQPRIEAGTRPAGDPLTSIVAGAPAGDRAPTYTSFESAVSVRQLLRTGAVATMSTSVARDGTNSALVLFDPAYTTSLGVDPQQPLLRNRAIDPSRAALRVTALDRDRSGAALARQVLQTVSEVESAYWQLVAARRDFEVRRATVGLAEQQREETQLRVQSGTAPASDLAQPLAELERRHREQLLAREAASRAERALTQLMLDDAGDPMWQTELVPADSPDAPLVSIDVTRALADAAGHRPEIAGLTATISQDDVDVMLARDALKPRVDLLAGYTLRDLAGSPGTWTLPFGGAPARFPESLRGGLTSSWRSTVDQDFHDALVAVRVEVPLGNRAARGQLGAAEANRRRSQTVLAQTQEQIASDVRNAVTALETAAGRIQSSRAGLAAAETQLRAEQDRFAAGLTTNVFVLTRQHDLAQAQLTETAALAAYRKALTEIGRATGTLLRDRGITLQ